MLKIKLNENYKSNTVSFNSNLVKLVHLLFKYFNVFDKLIQYFLTMAVFFQEYKTVTIKDLHTHTKRSKTQEECKKSFSR